MKTIKIYMASLLLMIATTINAQPMNYDAMRNNARFLTDRMAYTLGITSATIIDDIYRINYDYICGVNDYLDDIAYGNHIDYYNEVCYERDRALQYLLGDLIWNRLVTYDYFYRPISFANRRWSFIIYTHDMRINHYFCHTPVHYHNHYTGGHFFHGIKQRMDHRRTMNIVDKRNHGGGPREMHFSNGGSNNNRLENSNNHINIRENSNIKTDNNNIPTTENRLVNRNNNNEINVTRNNGTEGASADRKNTSDNSVNSERSTNNRSSYDRTDRVNRNYDRSNNNVRSSSRNYSGSNNSSNHSNYSSENARSRRSYANPSSRNNTMRNSEGSTRGNSTYSRGSGNGGRRR